MTEAAPERTREGELLVGKYRLEERLGAGGMGEVYRALNEKIGRTVAIKLLRPEWVSHPDLVARFLREAHAANLVRHPNVVEVLDVGQDESGVPFIVQEFLRGEDLARRLEGERDARPTARDAMQLVLPVLDAIAQAHAAGVIHRDLKPENVFLARGEDGAVVPKVLDFGISKIAGPESTRMTATGVAMGTPLYMSPEQIQGARDIDARADVWSIGVMLYEMLAGITPFDGQSQGDLFVQICTVDAPDLGTLAPHVPPALAALVMRCLRRNRAERPGDAGELARELRAVLATLDPAALAVAPPADVVRPVAPRAPTDVQTVGPLRAARAPQSTEQPAEPAPRRTPPRRVVHPATASAPGSFGGGMLGAGFVLLILAALAGIAGALRGPAAGWPAMLWWEHFAPTLSSGALTGAALGVCLAAALVIVQVLRDSPPSLGLILCGAGLVAEGFFLGRAAAAGSFAGALVDPTVRRMFVQVAPWALAAVPAGLGLFGLGRAVDALRYRARGGPVLGLVLLALAAVSLYAAAQITRGVLHPVKTEAAEDGTSASEGEGEAGGAREGGDAPAAPRESGPGSQRTRPSRAVRR